MRADIVAALALVMKSGIDATHIELAGSGDSSDYSYRAGPCKRVKSAAQQQREAKRRKNIRKRNK